MKVLIALLVLPLFALGETGRIVDVEKHHSASVISTGGMAFTTARETDIQVGSTIYVTENICKQAQMGVDYPVQIDKKHITLTAGKKACKYRITGQREVK